MILEIKITPENKPEVDAILKRMQDHTWVCDQCGKSDVQETGHYCATGKGILMELQDVAGVKKVSHG